MKSEFDLPDYWVYVYFEDKTKINVANSDTLEPYEAERFKKRFDGNNGLKVVAVTLEDGHGKVFHRYRYGKVKKRTPQR